MAPICSAARLGVLGGGDHVDRNVARVRRILQALQHVQAGAVGQAHVQQDGVGQELRGQLEAVGRAVRHQAAVAQLVRQVVQDVRELRLVLDHQHAAHLVARNGAVVGELRRGHRGGGCGRQRRGRHHRGPGRVAANARKARTVQEDEKDEDDEEVPGACGALAGNCRMKVLPWPGVLCTVSVPPSSCVRSREIDRPSPVPP
jgi:hypothetical protein